jgi:hypothetical protein
VFPFSGERRETSTLLGPLERANLNHLKTETDTVSETLFSNYLESRTMDEACKLSDCVFSRCYKLELCKFLMYLLTRRMFILKYGTKESEI